ncbi:MAG: hypothetical protein A2X67_03060 [Ignavibacteria bacterium GWA2_55_11]|nr:MAG: hypothetical protein A2X67_03060 [Ignavibacteria bacterium GWA2_55_11]OGU46785.1 MAG: hypothetical protein A2X68_03595 [Ignavibacteria bacterium GWC2_56_12]OGU67450.1 MAG: hypothetical protein A3C56_13120 [Ignavibacteria bacterium RIFCSPHIGHO2_02_FULL_56_12]OGU69746.1 MAG: hypothetical protein A3H45_11840 [Ignavibacteria bacterium RIFCSPLOWO2_02_FULL_55_14]OGU75896.1 MAG: hypothetical protein A3G43_08855 [Ignavibacteria bacterium RIFCSPLOWO2_12_FULL_56_21]HAV23296.1 DUF1385 domain-cont
MMRAPGSVATAVRRSDGTIAVQQFPYRSLIEKYPWLKTPILRGAVGLVDMMYIGIKTLNYSAEVAMEEVEAKKEPSNGDGTPLPKTEQSQWALIGSLVLALGMGVLIFFATPLYLTTTLFDLSQQAMVFNLVTGLIRITLFLAYLGAISMMRDIKRLFQYHGAEHKAVFAFELNADLVPTSVALQSRFHPRCGTSFLLIVMFVAILSFAVLDWFVLSWIGELTLVVRLATHLPFIPIVGGLSYEVIKFSAKHAATWWGRVLVAPGLWLQRITTSEPDHSQIEVAIVALKSALGMSPAPAEAPQTSHTTAASV